MLPDLDSWLRFSLTSVYIVKCQKFHLQTCQKLSTSHIYTRTLIFKWILNEIQWFISFLKLEDTNKNAMESRLPIEMVVNIIAYFSVTVDYSNDCILWGFQKYIVYFQADNVCFRLKNINSCLRNYFKRRTKYKCFIICNKLSAIFRSSTKPVPLLKQFRWNTL